ncbi:MAG: cytochrome c biogenesis protein CcsA [Waddliaceae bacterium]
MSYRFVLLLLFMYLPLQGVPIQENGRIRPFNGPIEFLNEIDAQEIEDTYLMLPSKRDPKRWISLHTLGVKNQDVRIGNFTAYPDSIFLVLQESYLAQDEQALKNALDQGYATLKGPFPTQFQLQLEAFYTRAPLIWILIALYLFALIPKVQIPFFLLAFVLHTSLIALRCYILERAPVTNMYETVLYVPWVTSLASLILFKLNRSKWLLTAGSLVSIFLFLCIKIGGLEDTLDNLQPVLNSQFWLVIHVLMVVGSYGLFALSSLLSHVYVINKRPSPDLIATTFYLATASLIGGTLLGGVWASQSWGRFWDWDPKESWAFISSSIALITIHAYRFRHIGSYGFAIGSILTFCFISFTWYGVNFILGTGLHSYGFGGSGSIYYLLFLLFEGAYISFVILKGYNSRTI